jgi:hypothetical protein
MLDDKTRKLKAFGQLTIENILDRAALLAHAYAYDKTRFLEYAARTWEMAKHDLASRTSSLEAEEFVIATSDENESPKTDGAA